VSDTGTSDDTGTGAAGKGRPTPKRSDSQRRRGGPVAPPPATRREAAKRLREQQAVGRKRIREGSRTGDPTAMLPRDRGAVRAAVRDTVDGRRNVAVLLLPVAALLLVSNFAGNDTFVTVASRVWTVALIALILDEAALIGRLRRTVKEQFPEERSVRGHILYGMLRSTQFRRLRVPPPRVRPKAMLRRR
jgi:Protein of unknown function (DUF3043)